MTDIRLSAEMDTGKVTVYRFDVTAEAELRFIQETLSCSISSIQIALTLAGTGHFIPFVVSREGDTVPSRLGSD